MVLINLRFGADRFPLEGDGIKYGCRILLILFEKLYHFSF